MKPHETIELIVTTVCRHYRADWRKSVSMHAGVKTQEREARRVIAHLVYIFLDEDYAKEALNVTGSTLRFYTKTFNDNIKELQPLQAYILKSINAHKQNVIYEKETNQNRVCKTIAQQRA